MSSGGSSDPDDSMNRRKVLAGLGAVGTVGTGGFLLGVGNTLEEFREWLSGDSTQNEGGAPPTGSYNETETPTYTPTATPEPKKTPTQTPTSTSTPEDTPDSTSDKWIGYNELDPCDQQRAEKLIPDEYDPEELKYNPDADEHIDWKDPENPQENSGEYQGCILD